MLNSKRDFSLMVRVLEGWSFGRPDVWQMCGRCRLAGNLRAMWVTSKGRTKVTPVRLLVSSEEDELPWRA